MHFKMLYTNLKYFTVGKPFSLKRSLSIFSFVASTAATTPSICHSIHTILSNTLNIVN